MKRLMMLMLIPACMAVAETAPATAKSYMMVKLAAAQKDAFLNDVAASFQKAKVIYLATNDGQGARVRPLRYTAIIDNKLVFATSAKKELFQQLVKNPEVEACSTETDESAFIRFKGKAVVCEDAATKDAFLKVFPKFGKMFGENFRLVAIEPEMAGIFPMKGGKPQTKTFSK